MTTSSLAPTIETPRLLLRAHRIDDFSPSEKMWGDALVTRYIGGRPFTRQETWTRLLRYVGHWALVGFGYWAVEEKATSRFVGEMGFADFKREIDPPLDGIPELGWVIAPEAQRKGYASEGLLAVTAWGEAHLPSRTTACLIHPENAASLRLAEKCGYRERLRTTYMGAPTVRLERTTR